MLFGSEILRGIVLIEDSVSDMGHSLLFNTKRRNFLGRCVQIQREIPKMERK